MNIERLGALSVIVSLAMAACPAAARDPLAERFANPPETAKVQCWWHWCGDNVTEKGIAADLKAMAEMGVGTAHFFSANMTGAIPGYHAGLLTPEWQRLFGFAVAEAKRYGIRLGFHNCPGWSSTGGPWIKPEDSMKVIASSATDVEAGAATARLARPPAKCDFYRDIAVFAFPIVPVPACVRASGDFAGDFDAFAKTGTPVTVPLSRGMDYRGTVTLEYSAPFRPGTLVIEMPQDRAVVDGTVEASADGTVWRELRKFHFNFYADVGDAKYLGLECGAAAKHFRVRFNSGRVPEWMGGKPFDVKLSKLAFTTLPMVPDVGACNSSTASFRYQPAADPNRRGIEPGALRMLSARPDADGTVSLAELWTNRGAKGVWRILRVGYTTTGKTCAPATLPGLECDKLSKRGLDAHWPHMPQVILDTPGAKGTVAVSIIDSFEAGGQNWTEDFPQEFKRRRGYDLMPRLPTVAGYAIGSAGDTQKFLFDYQQTVAELIAENYFDAFAERCRKAGLAVALESYGGPFDELRCFRPADIPTGEFWLGASPHGSPRLAASAGHLNGRSQIGAEAFTTEAMPGRWQLTPAELRVSGDRGWLEGISQIVFHSYVSQPFENVRPGLSLGRHGSQFNRNTTWWREGRWWAEYVRRGQFLLQAGKSVADLLVLRGVGRRDRTGRPERLERKGYTFDFCGKDDLLRLDTKDGRVFIPGEEAYQFLSLGDDRYLTTEVLEKVKALLGKGARICGGRPKESPSLADDPAKWRQLADEIWSGKYGTLIPTGDLILAENAFKTTPSADSKGCLGCIRRRIDGRDFFFVMNDRDREFDGTVAFASAGWPTLWNAKDGAVTRLERLGADGRSVLTRLEIAPRGSAFVGFVPHEDWQRCPEPAPDANVVFADISTGWMFRGACGNNPPFRHDPDFTTLFDWSKSKDPALRHFAGRIRYRRKMPGDDLRTAVDAGRRIVLDLGEVHEVANVEIDGRFVGCLWEKPYRIDITEALRATRGKASPSVELVVEVVNTWPNRMIGDAVARKNGAAEPVQKEGYPQWVIGDLPDSGTGIYTWSNFDYGWKADDEPLPAGLIGPVRLFSDRVRAGSSGLELLTFEHAADDAVFSNIFDRVTEPQILRTGDKAIHAVLFRRERGAADYVYALWTEGADAIAVLSFPHGAKVRTTDGLGRERDESRRLQVEFSAKPQYVIATQPHVRFVALPKDGGRHDAP